MVVIAVVVLHSHRSKGGAIMLSMFQSTNRGNIAVCSV